MASSGSDGRGTTRGSIVPVAPRRLSPRLRVIALLAAGAVLIVNATVISSLLSRDDALVGVDGVFEDDRAAAALAVGTTQATDLAALDAEASDAEVEALLGRATDDFSDSLADLIEEFREQAVADALQVEAEVSGSGVSRLRGDEAQVLVAITGTQQAPRAERAADRVPRPRDLRVRVDLTWNGSGWSVSGVGFL